MRMTIEESVKDELAYIGFTNDLQDQISKHIPKALTQGKQMMVSWAELESLESAFLHKAELLRAHKETHGKLPDTAPDGNYIPGARVVEKMSGQVSDLDWQGWYPMEPATIALVPRVPGVQRVRAE